jgi:PIN domain nuclease of toxin-antitoxin system
MRFLLDTHAILWFLNGDKNLSVKALQIILTPEYTKYVSIASVWEVAIKIGLRKLMFPGNTEGFIQAVNENGFELCPISPNYILELEKLPLHHRDPFDRMIIATAKHEKMGILTVDSNIQLYPVESIW